MPTILTTIRANTDNFQILDDAMVLLRSLVVSRAPNVASDAIVAARQLQTCVEDFESEAEQNYTYTDLSQTLGCFLGDLQLLAAKQRLAFAQALSERLGGDVTFDASEDVAFAVCSVDPLTLFAR